MAKNKEENNSKNNAGVKTSVFSISGMHCASCALTIERKVAELKGVKKASVNFASERLAVEHEEGIGSEEIVRAVKNAGYEAFSTAEAGEEKKQSRENSVVLKVV